MFGRPAVNRQSTCSSCVFNVGFYGHTFEPDYFIPALPIGFIDLYHFIPPPVILTLAQGHKVKGKQTCWHQFHTHFSTDDDEFDVVLKFSVTAFE